jgi:hypothetical protein
MFISLTTAKFIAISTARFWDKAIVAATAMIVATTAMITNSIKGDCFLAFVGQEFFFGHNVHNRENPEINISSLDINLDINFEYFPWAAISYRSGQDFRSGRHRRNLGLACT